MRIEQSFTVGYPRDLVWSFFQRVDEVALCMPGASLTEPFDGTRIKGQLGVKLGPISAAFAGDAELDQNEQEHSGRIQGTGRDGKSGSRAKGEIVYQVRDVNDGHDTQVDITVDFSLAGALAQFGRSGIVNDIAARLTAEFVRNLEARLAAISVSSDETAGTAGSSPAFDGETPAAKVDAIALLFAILWSRIKSILARMIG